MESSDAHIAKKLCTGIHSLSNMTPSTSGLQEQLTKPSSAENETVSKATNLQPLCVSENLKSVESGVHEENAVPVENPGAESDANMSIPGRNEQITPSVVFTLQITRNKSNCCVNFTVRTLDQSPLPKGYVSIITEGLNQHYATMKNDNDIDEFKGIFSFHPYSWTKYQLAYFVEDLNFRQSQKIGVSDPFVCADIPLSDADGDKSHVQQKDGSVDITGGNWKIGDLCLALHSEDDLYHQAKILEVFEEDAFCLVKFVGYDNEEEVNTLDLRPMWKIGELCLALHSEDDLYHQAKILEVFEEDAVCLVKFVGYVNEEEVDTLDLRPMWKIGELCLALYSEDGLYYQAEILEVFEEDTFCLVKFDGYDDEEEVDTLDLRPLIRSSGLHGAKEAYAFDKAAEIQQLLNEKKDLETSHKALLDNLQIVEQSKKEVLEKNNELEVEIQKLLNEKVVLEISHKAALETSFKALIDGMEHSKKEVLKDNVELEKKLNNQHTLCEQQMKINCELEKSLKIAKQQVEHKRFEVDEKQKALDEALKAKWDLTAEVNLYKQQLKDLGIFEPQNTKEDK